MMGYPRTRNAVLDFTQKPREQPREQLQGRAKARQGSQPHCKAKALLSLHTSTTATSTDRTIRRRNATTPAASKPLQAPCGNNIAALLPGTRYYGFRIAVLSYWPYSCCRRTAAARTRTYSYVAHGRLTTSTCGAQLKWKPSKAKGVQ